MISDDSTSTSNRYSDISKIEIYVIYHKRLEDTNMFTTNYYQITNFIKKLAKKTKTDPDEWQFRVIREQELFEANMSDF